VLSNASACMSLEINPSPHPSELMTLYSPRLLILLIVLKHLYEIFNWKSIKMPCSTNTEGVIESEMLLWHQAT